MTFRFICKSAIFASAVMLSTSINAQAFENPEAIERQVATFIGVDPSEAGKAFLPVDRRLRLSNCAAPLALSWYGTKKGSVLVQCPQPGGWKIYVRTLGTSMEPTASTPVVNRGDAVTVTINGGGFSISHAAEVMESGMIGQWVRIRVNKGNEMRAKVIRPDAVSVDLP